jgi:hypothetical protein
VTLFLRLLPTRTRDNAVKEHISTENDDNMIPDDLPDFFWRLSDLSMDALKGPDEQYRAGARDMFAAVRLVLDRAYHPQLGENSAHPIDVLDSAR